MRLRKLEMDGLTRDDIDVINRFCDGWMANDVPNQAVRTNSQNFRAEIAFATTTKRMLRHSPALLEMKMQRIDSARRV